MLNTGLEQMVAEKTASLTQAYTAWKSRTLPARIGPAKIRFYIDGLARAARPLTNINGGIELLLAGAYPFPDRPPNPGVGAG